MLAILTESLLKISQLIGTPRNTFLGNYNNINNLCPKYIPIVSTQMLSYAPLKTALQVSVGRFAFSRGTNMLLYFPVMP